MRLKLALTHTYSEKQTYDSTAGKHNQEAKKLSNQEQMTVLWFPGAIGTVLPAAVICPAGTAFKHFHLFLEQTEKQPQETSSKRARGADECHKMRNGGSPESVSAETTHPS